MVEWVGQDQRSRWVVRGRMLK